jgi:RND family efflux transporter MFP subunit
VASDDGIVSARTATVGMIVQPGQELFRIIRGARLEWRAEVGAAELGRIKPGQTVRLTAPGGEQIDGTVRALAPTVDPKTATALVYVDVPATAAGRLSAGMFASGEFKLGNKPALTLPQSALLLREGFAFVFKLDGSKVVQVKVATDRRNDDRIEVTGLDAAARVVASGVGFLADGDTVRIVDNAEAKPKQ